MTNRVYFWTQQPRKPLTPLQGGPMKYTLGFGVNFSVLTVVNACAASQYLNISGHQLCHLRDRSGVPHLRGRS